MKYILIILAVLLTGCTSMDKFVCVGAGTCFGDERDDKYAGQVYSSGTAAFVPTGGQQVMMPNGGYMIVRSQSTGRVMSVFQTSKTK